MHRYAERGQLSVLTYHGVLPAEYEVMDPQLDGSWVRPDEFRRQMRLLHSRHNVVSPSQVRLWCKGEVSLPPRAVLLTCDDGLANAVTDMLPILQEEGLTCLFFVTSRSLAEEPSMLWYEELYLTLLDVPEGAFEGTFCGVSVKTHLDSSAPLRTSCWYSMVEMLSTCTLKPDWDLPGRCVKSSAFRKTGACNISSKEPHAFACWRFLKSGS